MDKLGYDVVRKILFWWIIFLMILQWGQSELKSKTYVSYKIDCCEYMDNDKFCVGVICMGWYMQ